MNKTRCDEFVCDRLYASLERRYLDIKESYSGRGDMEQEQIHHQGTQPLNGNDAYTVLGIVFDWITEVEQKTPLLEPNMGNSDQLLDQLRQAGYCCCTTEFGCVACGGRNFRERQ